MMPPPVTPEQRRLAKQNIVKAVQQGASASVARSRSEISMHRTTVYRLLKRVQNEGEGASTDGRHGHPVKLRGEVLAFVREHCQANLSVSSAIVQHELHERFTLSISISQLNRVRASLGLIRKPAPREKKPKNVSVEPGYSEVAGGLLLLAAATGTGLLTQLTNALPTETIPARPPLARRSPLVHQRLLLTLLFLGTVGLHRTWDLRSYTADGLALLTGCKRAYGYRYTEAFLSQIAQAGCAESFTDALARWTTDLWHPETEDPETPQSFTCYIDGHRKPVYSEMLIPRGLIGRLGVILGCRALVLLHDDQGHPLLATTHRGDQHLTVGLPSIIARYEASEGRTLIKRIIVDREGMATEFLARLHAEGRIVVTILHTTQYRDLSSFSDVGTFVPLSTDAHG